jgi:hypothetical protein
MAVLYNTRFRVALYLTQQLTEPQSLSRSFQAALNVASLQIAECDAAQLEWGADYVTKSTSASKSATRAQTAAALSHQALRVSTPRSTGPRNSLYRQARARRRAGGGDGSAVVTSRGSAELLFYCLLLFFLFFLFFLWLNASALTVLIVLCCMARESGSERRTGSRCPRFERAIKKRRSEKRWSLDARNRPCLTEPDLKGGDLARDARPHPLALHS